MPIEGSYQLPFSIVSARISQKRSWSHGRDIFPAVAYTKAISEAKEWAACGNLSEDIVRSKFGDLSGAINPTRIVRFHPAQYSVKKFPFKPFDENKKYSWVEGKNEITGLRVYVLADLVYFPYFPKNPYYAYANSSGVAAHPNREKAVETSALELIERDSFMIAYLTRIDFPSVREESLPSSIRTRIENLKKNGFKVWIKDHSLDIAPVICVLSQSEEYQCTVCASSANFDITEALNHALMEVEASVLVRLRNGPPKKIKPREVVMPLDHGNLYGQKRYFHQADFLLSGQKMISLNEVGSKISRSWQEFKKRLKEKKMQLLTILLSHDGNDNLYIIRSIIPGLVPMTFGYRQEPAGMERIYEIAKEFGGRKLSYRELTKFPHPFA
jgi:ribosomal protein S12 methylthiotransferase accessory factor